MAKIIKIIKGYFYIKKKSIFAANLFENDVYTALAI